MKHQLLHIYGPIAVYSYGLAITIGLLFFIFLIKRNKRFERLQLDGVFSELLIISILAAIIGGRLVFLLGHPDQITSFVDLCAPWTGGYSILGSIIGVLLVAPLYLWYKQKPIIPTLDVIAIYAPLLQAISRLGCLCAGCCYGLPTQLPWGISYADHASVAPLFVCMHPTQLYSSILLFIIFLAMFFYFQHNLRKVGQLSCMYLLLVSAERFVVDFWRGDRVFIPAMPFISFHQLIALGICTCAAILFTIITFLSRRSYEHI